MPPAEIRELALPLRGAVAQMREGDLDLDQPFGLAAQLVLEVGFATAMILQSLSEVVPGSARPIDLPLESGHRALDLLRQTLRHGMKISPVSGGDDEEISSRLRADSTTRISAARCASTRSRSSV